MVYFRNKYFIETRPLFFPDKHFVVISYQNFVEVHDHDHVIVWKVEEESKVVSLEKYENNKTEFFVALENGVIKRFDLNNFSIQDVTQLNVNIKKIYLTKNGLLTLEKDGIYDYPDFDLDKKKLISIILFENIAFSPKTEIIAITKKKEIYVKKLSGENEGHIFMTKWLKERCFTSIACHPKENHIATGDTTGQIIIWWNVLNGFKQTSNYHWHFLELNSIEYNFDGTTLLSGGKEGVFVKWQITINDSDVSKRFYPRLESHIESIRSCSEVDGEYYLLTLADNSYRIITSLMGCINTYYNLMQRSKFFYNKVAKKSKMCPVGLIGCYNLPGQLKYSVMTNGHEGSLQFFDLLNNEVRHQLDITCQNWPTETENYLIPGFIQVQKVAISHCGLYLATYEEIGVPSNLCDYLSTVRLFHWSSDDEKFVQQSIIPFDICEMVVDIIFHPSKNEYVIFVTQTTKLVLVSRTVHGDNVLWKIVHNIDLAEVLYPFYTCLVPEKYHQNAVLSTVVCPHNESDGLLSVGSNRSLTVYLWSHIIQFKTTPLVTRRTHRMQSMIKMPNKSKKRIVSDIVSQAIFNNPTDVHRYRIVCGLFCGLLLVDVVMERDGSVSMREVNIALCELNGCCLVSRSPQSATEVAVLFKNNNKLSIFDVWDNSSYKYTDVKPFYRISWARVKDEHNEDKWVVTGLIREANRIDIVTCEDPPKRSEIKKISTFTTCGVDLISGQREEEGVIFSRTKKLQTKKADDKQIRSFTLYDSLGMTMALETLYSL